MFISYVDLLNPLCMLYFCMKLILVLLLWWRNLAVKESEERDLLVDALYGRD